MKFKRQLLQHIFSIPLVLFMIVPVMAQNKYTISGEVKDKQTGETLLGATIYVQENRSLGTTTNDYGFYSLTLPEGNYTLIIEYFGFEKKIQPVSLHQDIKLNIQLSEQVAQLNEVVISGDRPDRNVTSTEMSVTKLDIKELNKVPVIFGERDVLKTIQLLPGIKSAGEGNAGFYVRGGGADQNLILLDEAPVYNASHLLGFFSTFNSDAIKDVTVYKGGMPSQYGGRLSSVLDIKMKDGNSKKLSVAGGIGLISSRLTVEAPIVKDKGSIMISGRRTYADMFLKLSGDEQLKNNKLYFYDLNVKANYRLGENDKVYVSGYFGRDHLGLGDLFGIRWGNGTATARWNHLFNDRLFSNTSFIFSNYNYNIQLQTGSDKISILSGIQDFNLKEDMQYTLNQNNNLKFGFNVIRHSFIPGKVLVEGGSSINDIEIEKRRALENAIYISNEQKLSERFKINYGIRYSMFTAYGKGSVFDYDKDGNTIDTTIYTSGKIQKHYGGLEPRLSANYTLNSTSSVKASYVRTYQYLHLLSNSTTSSPTDLWLPSSKLVKPQIADQIAVGYFKNFKENAYETSVEVYYKGLKNQIDYKNGADILLNPNVESQLVFGKGWSYGAEFFIKKKYGKLNGWIGYTWSRTERKFDDINNAKKFFARQDRTHDISIVAMYDISDRWNLAATWVYGTGNAVTFPTGGYMVDNQLVPMYSERNGYRMPANHRLDIGATYIRKKTEKFESSWNFSLYNAYGRQNPYMIRFQQNENNPQIKEAVQVSLFRWIPSVTYNFKF